jgi:hypothetical protein
MDGPGILVASMSVPTPRGGSQALWQYHPRSDSHSKVGCWGALFDLLQQSRVLRGHAHSGTVIFGVNFEMRDFGTGRKKRLDLVIARPSQDVTTSTPRTLADLASAWSVVLTPAQQDSLAALPALYSGPVGAVLMALEAKAAMTAHTKAQPRLYDELNSSHLTVHGASRGALAVGLVMVNISRTFISPDLNASPPRTLGQKVVVSQHAQPADTAGLIAKMREIPRRTGTQTEGYDGLGVVVVDAPNDDITPIQLVTTPPAPQTGDVLHYDTMITRVANEYDRAFHDI